MREWLIELREKSALSQEEVAAKAGISQSFYSAIELGNRGSKLPVQTAKKIAEVLDFKWDMFYQTQ
ncbi:helix-turn-helix transcriptional regulator [Christensenellaceae bacterium 44-20]